MAFTLETIGGEESMQRLWLAIVVVLCVGDLALPEEPVDFADVRLKAAVEETLWVSDPTRTDMLGLTELTCIGERPKENGIVSLSGLEHAANLQSLTLRCHLVRDISPLAGLVNLRMLVLHDNEITDISAVSALTGLWTLDLTRNRVSDCSPLSGLTELSTLSLHRNRVSDISPLAVLTSLTWFDLRINPLNQEAYDIYIDQIIANNSGIWFVYDPHFHRRILVEAAPGGSVTEPGMGAFTRPFGEYIWLIAAPDPGYRFGGWVGSYATTQNPMHLLVDQDYEVLATFVRALETIHVDDNAPDDSGPDDPDRSDPGEDGTPEHPFDRIQEAIDVAAEGAFVFVRSGTYRENIDLRGKNIHLSGIHPSDRTPAAYPVIMGLNAGPVVSFVSGEGLDCKLSAIAISNGRGQPASAIHCAHSSPLISNCLIVGNRTTDPHGATILCRDSGATFINCTISDNAPGEFGATVVASGGHVTLVNSILDDIVSACIGAHEAGEVSVSYSNLVGGLVPSAEAIDIGAGNIEAETAFAQRGRWVDKEDPTLLGDPRDPTTVWVAGDYHLKSQAGRWDPSAKTWIQDDVTSPCIDGGDGTMPVGDEPPPNGAVLNLGAYGGTRQASKSLRIEGTF